MMNPKNQASLKARLYVKLHGKKILELSPVGLYHIISACLTVALTSDPSDMVRSLLDLTYICCSSCKLFEITDNDSFSGRSVRENPRNGSIRKEKYQKYILRGRNGSAIVVRSSIFRVSDHRRVDCLSSGNDSEMFQRHRSSSSRRAAPASEHIHRRISRDNVAQQVIKSGPNQTDRYFFFYHTSAWNFLSTECYAFFVGRPSV